jgi:putative peptidoglycan lipid II flippase
MACIVLFAPVIGVKALAWGLIAGLIAQTLVLGLTAPRLGFTYTPALEFRHPAIREMLGPAVLLLFTIGAVQVNATVDRVMASALGPGSLSALSYADKLVQVPLIIFAGSIGTAVFPYFSAQITNKKTDDFVDSLTRTIKISGLIFLPLTALAVVLAQPVIQLLFQRGAFSLGATGLTASIFVLYALQFFFYTLVLVLNRVLIAFNDISSLLKITAVSVVTNIAFNLLFLQIIRPAAAGIALSTSAVLFVSSLLFIRHLRTRDIRLPWKDIAGSLLKSGTIAVLLAAGTALAFRLAYPFFVYRPALNRLCILTLILFLAAALFVALSRLLRVPELPAVALFLRSKFTASASRPHDQGETYGMPDLS